MIVVKTKCLSKDSSFARKEGFAKSYSGMGCLVGFIFWVFSGFFSCWILDTWAPEACGRKVISSIRFFFGFGILVLRNGTMCIDFET